MKNIFLVFIIPALLLTCANQPENILVDSVIEPKEIMVKEGTTVLTRFNPPDSFVRLVADSNSFAFFLRSFPLKKDGSKVLLYNGEEKFFQAGVAAVLDIDVGTKDLQQCADAVMRLRAEYLYQHEMYSKIHFNFTNGFMADYIKWAEGSRVKISGNNTSWYAGAEKDYSYENFRKYLELVFSYAGTLSLSKELKTISVDSIVAGDVFIYGGSPGHAVIVTDVAQHIRTGERVFMIAQSYMPAQNIHLLRNLNDLNISPWYNLKGTDLLLSPEWTFKKSQLKRFAD